MSLSSDVFKFLCRDCNKTFCFTNVILTLSTLLQDSEKNIEEEGEDESHDESNNPSQSSSGILYIRNKFDDLDKCLCTIKPPVETTTKF